MSKIEVEEVSEDAVIQMDDEEISRRIHEALEAASKCLDVVQILSNEDYYRNNRYRDAKISLAKNAIMNVVL